MNAMSSQQPPARPEQHPGLAEAVDCCRALTMPVCCLCSRLFAADPELGPIFKDSGSNMLVLRKHTTYFIHQVQHSSQAGVNAAAVLQVAQHQGLQCCSNNKYFQHCLHDFAFGNPQQHGLSCLHQVAAVGPKPAYVLTCRKHLQALDRPVIVLLTAAAVVSCSVLCSWRSLSAP